jgi:hypothetical protein
MTFTANTPLTAAQLNTHLRDNLLETAPAKAAIESQYMVAVGVNKIKARVLSTNRVPTSETLSGGEDYSDLATVGPSVTVDTGQRAMVFCYAKISHNTIGGTAAMNWAVTGATERDPKWEAGAVVSGQPTAARSIRTTGMDIITTLTPGTNTFTSKYRVFTGTGTFADRFLGVIPF